MCCDDYDAPELYQCRVHKARKLHKCDECHRAIEIGETYEAHSGRWEGTFEVFKWCEHCRAAQDIKATLTDCHCWLFGGLYEDISEIASGWTESIMMYRLKIWMGRKWRVKRGPRADQLVPIPRVPETIGA